MLDVIGSADMITNNLTNFTVDRFGNENSALALNGGYTQISSGVYFNTPEFTISVWVYPQEVGSWSRIIDFGNGNGNASDNIVFALSYGTTLQPTFQIFDGTQHPSVILAESNKNLRLNTWQFLTVTFNGTNSCIYLNGILTVNLPMNYTLPIVQRNNCYIGKSFDWRNGYSWSYIDDLRFYNRSLTQKEIFNLMNTNYGEIHFISFII